MAGHFGLEAVAFTAFPARMPTAFPAVAAKVGLHFGQILAASRAFREGSGAVLFPEQLAVRTRPNRQAFGVVFLDKLVELFRARVLPVLDDHALPMADRSPQVLRDLRRLAFLAHEWGHQAGTGAEQTVPRPPAPPGRGRQRAARRPRRAGDAGLLSRAMGCGSGPGPGRGPDRAPGMAAAPLRAGGGDRSTAAAGLADPRGRCRARVEQQAAPNP
ncbi:MAG: hypothetical protein M3460_05185 [Actinomycetota bacterium]|nr:hypothetical protein [Actinomycetota bacterium]